jgi:uncharacterized protein
MPLTLTDVEARILGSLIEKSLTTPDQYPLSLNSLVNACNQKSSRDPVMNLDETTVARNLAGLQEKGLVTRRSEPGSRVTKFQHHAEVLLNGGTSKEVGTICLLLLRGPQTPGEIRTRADRLCEFTGPAEVEAALNDLAARTDGPFVERLPRQSGQKETRWRHLFSSPTEKNAPRPAPVKAPAAVPFAPSDRYAELEKRVAQLENEVKELKSRLTA